MVDDGKESENTTWLAPVVGTPTLPASGEPIGVTVLDGVDTDPAPPGP